MYEKANDDVDLYQVCKFMYLVCKVIPLNIHITKMFSFNRLLLETCIDAVTSIYYKYIIYYYSYSNFSLEAHCKW